MICALVAATRFTFVYEGVKENIQLGELKNQIWKKAKKAGQIVTRPASFGRQRLEEEEPDGYPSTGYDTSTTKNEEYSGYGPSPYSTTMDEKRDPEKRIQITLQGENGAVGTHPGGAVQDVKWSEDHNYLHPRAPRWARTFRHPARDDDRAQDVRYNPLRSDAVSHLVYGIRCWSHVYISLLASTGL